MQKTSNESKFTLFVRLLELVSASLKLIPKLINFCFDDCLARLVHSAYTLHYSTTVVLYIRTVYSTRDSKSFFLGTS